MHLHTIAKFLCAPCGYIVNKYWHIWCVLALHWIRSYEEWFSEHIKLQHLIQLVIRHVCSRLLELLLEAQTRTRTHNSLNMLSRLALERIAAVSVAVDDPLRMIISLTLNNLRCDNYCHILGALSKVVKDSTQYFSQSFHLYSSRVNFYNLGPRSKYRGLYATLVRIVSHMWFQFEKSVQQVHWCGFTL